VNIFNRIGVFLMLWAIYGNITEPGSSSVVYGYLFMFVGSFLVIVPGIGIGAEKERIPPSH
jgi:hypothetical protein